MKRKNIARTLLIIIVVYLVCAFCKTNQGKLEANSIKIQDDNINYIKSTVTFIDEEKYNSKYQNNYKRSVLFPNNEKLIQTNDIYKKIYKDIAFPFLKDNSGYYSFDSNNYYIEKDQNEKKYNLFNEQRGCFYPYESKNEIINERFFTAKLEIPFIMTSDGKTKNEKTGQLENMFLKITTDAYAQVAIDGQLVIDLNSEDSEQTGYYELNDSITEGQHVATVYYIDRSIAGTNFNIQLNLKNYGIKVNEIDEANWRILNTRYIAGLPGDKITINANEYSGYRIITDNSILETIEREMKEVIFIYQKQQDLIISYIDQMNNEKIEEDIILHTWCGESYTSKPKEIKNYTLVSTPGNAEGEVKDYNYIVEYLYKYSNARININYIDKVNGKNIKSETKTGIDGDLLEIQDNSIDNYRIIEKPNEIRFSKKEQTIDVYCIHQSKIKVNYIDKEKNKNITESTELYMDEGSTYKPVLKEFENYKLIENPDKEYIVRKEDIEINCYYKELLFNIKLEMKMKKAIIDERYYELKGILGKIETEDTVDDNSLVKIYYTVKVTNDEEREGNCLINIDIPEGYYAIDSENILWNINNNKMSIYFGNFKPNESKEFPLVLTKNNNTSVFGLIKNIARASSQISETKTSDNEAKNEVVIISKTGAIIIKTTWLFITCVLIVLIIIVVKNKDKNRNKNESTNTNTSINKSFKFFKTIKHIKNKIIKKLRRNK